MESVRCGFLPGVDPLKLNQLVDELEVDRSSWSGTPGSRRGALVILPDINLLMYAVQRGYALATFPPSRTWWERCLSGTDARGTRVGGGAGLRARLMSNRALACKARCGLHRKRARRCRSWLLQPNVRIVLPGPTHMDILELGLLCRTHGTQPGHGCAPCGACHRASGGVALQRQRLLSFLGT